MKSGSAHIADAVIMKRLQVQYVILLLKDIVIFVKMISNINKGQVKSYKLLQAYNVENCCNREFRQSYLKSLELTYIKFSLNVGVIVVIRGVGGDLK